MNEPTLEQLPDILRAFLADASTLGLATTDADGKPHAANLNFVEDADLNLFWVSNPESAHSRHVAARPDTAVTVYTPFERPDRIRGLQLHGRCEAVDDFDTAWARFCAKFPYATAFEAAAREETFYRFTPSWLRWIDNTVRFRFRMETEWPLGCV